MFENMDACEILIKTFRKLLTWYTCKKIKNEEKYGIKKIIAIVDTNDVLTGKAKMKLTLKEKKVIRYLLL